MCCSAAELLLTGSIFVYKVHMSPASLTKAHLQHFKPSDVLEIHDKIIFNFYLGLPHMVNTGVVPSLHRYRYSNDNCVQNLLQGCMMVSYLTGQVVTKKG